MKKIVILLGSLRKNSFSKIIASAVEKMFPEGYEVKIADLHDLKLYNDDLDKKDDTDPTYVEFRNEIDGLDGALFITPEYNRSLPAVIKNAIDVGSRPHGQSKWDGKPAAIISYSPSRLGAFGANHALRQSLVWLNMPVVQQPEVYLSFVNKSIEDGELKQKEILDLLQKLVDALVEKVEILNK